MLQPITLKLIGEHGICTDGSPARGEDGLIKMGMIDWDKTNPIIQKKLVDMLFDCSDLIKEVG